MNDREIIIAIKDLLNDKLEDPREQWTGAYRSWVHTDEPLNTATYPRIQVRKRGPTQTTISSMGRENFLEFRELVLDIQIWTHPDFKYEMDGGYFIKEGELIKEWLPKIWDTIKSNHSMLIRNYGISGIKNLSEDSDGYEPDTGLYTGIISVRLWDWKR
jgi:hypothetical protein